MAEAAADNSGYYQQYPGYAPPSSAAPQYGAPPPAYGAPQAYGGAYGAPPQAYGAPASAYGAPYGAPSHYPPPHQHTPGIQYDSADGSEIRTIFITGFPADVKERELNNMCRFLPGYTASQMNWKLGQAQGFALFDTGAAAVSACAMLAHIQFDESSVLRAEIARKNMFVKDDNQGNGLKRPRFAGGFTGTSSTLPGSNTYMGPSGTTTTTIAAGSTPVIQPVAPQGFAAVSNLGDNPPCSTLFVGNLGDAVSESEFLGLFGSQPGFKQMKIVRGARSTTGFVEFNDTPTAQAVHQSLQGAILASSDRGGIRIQFSKNPFGKKRDAY